jgi:hypothetical protein
MLTNSQRKKTRTAATLLVTPFSGFILSQHFLSDEIDKHRLSWLNPRSRRLKHYGPIKIEVGDVIYCQVDQLENFVKSFLPRISNPYVLISGKWQLPALQESRYVQTILADDKLLAWFSQNQIYDDLPISPFPYGINLESVASVFARLDEIISDKDDSVLIPFAKVHSHLISSSKRDREFLSKFMEAEKSLDEYLEDINTHKWVVSPAGDRPDTYRHWEIIALGSIPITKLPKNFKKLFGSSALLIEDYATLPGIKDHDNSLMPNRSLATLDSWRNRVNAVKNSGRTLGN